MKIFLEHLGKRYWCQTDQARSLAIDLDFGGPQPNFFNAPLASQQMLQLGTFTASTKQGSGCNVRRLQLTPHCNGTHTETISHIVDDMVSIGALATGPGAGPFVAAMITVPTTPAPETHEIYRPDLETTDHVITCASLKSALASLTIAAESPAALIIRTTPNTQKRSARYDDQHQHPFFSVPAIEHIVELGIDHLLVDIPSIDRLHDQGHLTNHHLFWNVPAGTHQLTEACWDHKTITEMIFASDDLADGLYLLDLQIPSFLNTDAAPSRPVVYPLYE